MTRISALNQGQLASMGIKAPFRADPKLAGRAVRQQVKGVPITGEISAPAYEVSDVFSYQSYFDDNLQERALFRQNPNEPIVKSTLSEQIQVAGYGIALHPSSETPVAVQFDTGAQQGKSQTYRLKPGELIRPEGKEFENGQFSGFRWGLPFGWLGGGSATLVVLRATDCRVEWASDFNEVVYHRIRLPIQDPAGLPVVGGAYSGPLNWPQRFPWPLAMFGTDSLTQRGQPALSIAPTRTALSLRLAALTLDPAPNDGVMRMYWVGADVWAQTGPNAQGVGTISLADVRATDQIWGTWAQQAGAAAPFNSAFQTMLLTGEAERYAANAGALVLASLDSRLEGSFVDIVRWGHL